MYAANYEQKLNAFNNWLIRHIETTTTFFDNNTRICTLPPIHLETYVKHSAFVVLKYIYKTITYVHM